MSSYRMTFDYHTHTIYSESRIGGKHAVGTMEENVVAAIERGLDEVAISDHGPGHVFYGLKKKKIPEMKAEINRLRDVYPQIKIYFSVEANISETGCGLDVSPQEAGEYDFLLAGYHFGTRNAHCIPNWMISKKLGGRIDTARIINTEMIVNALKRNDIKVLTHPGAKGPVFMDEIAKACAETDTIMEISTWHPHLTVKELEIAMKEDVRFIISSDAHKPERVGTFEGGLKRALAAGLDPERIVNIAAVEQKE